MRPCYTNAPARPYSHHMKVRRVVTDHDEQGRAIVSADEVCKGVSARPGHERCDLWKAPDGTVFRLVEYRPGVAPRNHRTETVDYAIVLSGEIEMDLDGTHRAPAPGRRAGPAQHDAQLGEPRRRALRHRVRAGACQGWPRCGGLAFSWRGSSPGAAIAQSDYPARAVRIVVPSLPGGGTDIVARVLASNSPGASASRSWSRTSPAPAT